MASKQIIETNKLKVSSNGAKGLYVGNVESKYAVMTDSAKSQTVIYDKVTYDFAVTDLATTVPASGQTYTIAASVSTRTHGNGAVDQVTFSPTSITVPANTGASYTSSITVTQTTSNLTDEYSFTVAADAVKSIALSLSNVPVIPASGGTVSSCSTAATVTYYSGRQVTNFTPTTVKWGTAVSASSKGTTVSSQNSAGSLTCYIVYGGVTSNTVTVTINQAANAVVSTGLTDITITSPATAGASIGEIPANGGTKQPTLSAEGGVAWTSYTSTSSAQTTPNKTWNVTFTNSGNFTLKSSTTGQISASTKGTTMSNVTTSNTATAKVSATVNGVTKSASTTYYVTQAHNHVVSATATTASTGTHVYYADIGPAETSAPVITNGGVILTYNSGETSKITGSNPTGVNIAWNRTYTLAKSQNGFTSVANNGTLTATSLGTTISNARSSAVVTSVFTPVITHTSTYGGSVVSATSMTCEVTCTQGGNYVTGITVANAALSYSQIAAAGGTANPSGSNGTVTYKFTTGQSTTTTPGTTYGSIESSVSYSLASTSGGYSINSSTGVVSVDSKGTNISTVTSSDTITKSVTWTWTPTSGYDSAGTKQVSTNPTNKASQAGNYVSSISVSSVGMTYAQIGAGGGTVQDTGSNGSVTYTYTSNATSTTAPSETYGSISSSKSYSMTSGNGFSIGTSTGAVTATSKGTSVSDITSSNTITKTVTYTWTPATGYTAGGTKTNNGSATNVKATQAANAITGQTDYQTPTGLSITAPNIPASGGTASGTWSGTCKQRAKNVYTSNATADTYTEFTISSPGKSIDNGSSVASKGTTISTTTSGVATVTGYYWANGKTAETTYSVSQDGNYVTGLTMTDPTVTYAQFDASGGTKNDTGANGTVTYAFSSKSTSTTTPGTTYGSISSAATYSMTKANGFELTDSSTGAISANTKGTTISNATSSSAVTKTVTWTWTPASGYDAAGTKTTSKSKTGTASQKANYITNVTVAGGSISYAQIPASGGTKTPTGGYGTYTYTFSSGGSTSTAPASTYGTSSVTVTYSMTSGGGFTLVSTSTGEVTADTRGTETSNSARSSNDITRTVQVSWTHATNYSAGGTKTGSESKTTNATQAANTYTDSWNNPVVTLSYATTIPAGGGTCAPTVSATQSGTRTWSSNSTSGITNTNFTYSYAMTASGRWTISSGTVNATTRGTTVGSAEQSPQVTVTATGSGSKTGTATAKATQQANAITNSNYSPKNYDVSITIGNGITAAGGSATVTASAWHEAQNLYTSNETDAYSQRTDTANVSEDSDNNNRYSYSNGTLTHSTMGTNVTTDTCVMRVRNASNTATTKTATVSVANEIVSYTGHANLQGRTISASVVPAAGGTSTITWGGTATATRKPVYTSTAIGSSVTYNPSVSTAVSGNTAVATKGTAISNETTAIDTVTGYYYADGLTASTTTSVKQAGNYVSAIESSNPTATYATFPAAGDTKSDTGGNGSITKYTYTSTATGTTTPSNTYGSASSGKSYTMTAGNGFTIKTSTGAVTAASRGTETGSTRSSNTITKSVTWTWTPSTSYSAGGTKTSTKTNTTTASQSANSVTGYTDYQNPTGLSIAASTVPAAGGTATISWTPSNLKGSQQAKAVYSSNATSTTYTTLEVTCTTNVTGNSNVSSKGTTISNATTAIATVTGTYSANGKSNTTTCSVTQAANYVTNVEATGATDANHFYYNNVNPSSSSTATNRQVSRVDCGAAKYTFSSGQNVVVNEGETLPFGGTATYSRSGFTMTTNSTFTAIASTTGVLSRARNSATTISLSVTSNSISGKLVVSYTHASNYSAGGTKTSAAYTSSTTCKQNGNHIVSLSNYSAPSLSYSQISAGGGSVAASPSNGSFRYTLANGRTGRTASVISAFGSSSATRSFTMSTDSVFTKESSFSTNGQVSAESRGTTTGATLSSNTITMAVEYKVTPNTTYSNDGASAVTFTNTATSKATQAANAITGTTWNNPSGTYLLYATTIPASGGTSTPRVDEPTQSGTITYTSSATAATSNTEFAYSFSMNESGRWTINTSTGVVSASTRGTVTGSNENSPTVTVTVTGAGGKTETATDYAIQSKNEVTSTTWGNISVASFSYGTAISAGGGTATPSVTVSPNPQTGTSYYSSGSNSQVTNSSFSYSYSAGTLSTGFSKASDFSTTGKVSAASRTNAFGAARSSGNIRVTITGSGSKTASAVTTVSQSANAITSMTATSPSLTYATFPASGGTKSDTGGGGSVAKYTFASGTDVTTKPSATYGSLSSGVTYTMTTGNGFSIASNGNVTADNRAKTTGAARSSNLITKTVTWTWKPTTNYNWFGNVTASEIETGTASQEANTTSETWNNPSVSVSYSTFSAAGETKTPSTATASQSGTRDYTSGSQDSLTGTISSSYTMTANSYWTKGTNFASNGNLTAAGRGTTTGTSRTSPNITVTVSGSGGKTASITVNATQEANAVTSTTWGNVTIGSYDYGTLIPAGGGTSTPTILSVSQTGTNYYTSGSNASTTNTSFTYSYSAGTLTSGLSTASTFATNGAISGANRTTTVGDARTGKTKVTVTGQGGKTASKEATVTQQANAITGYTDYANPTGLSLTGNTVAASGTGSSNATVGWNGTASQTAKAVYTSNSTASTRTTISPAPTVSTAMTGNGVVSSKGSTISKETTAKTVTGYYWANGATASTTYYVKQDANFVVGLTLHGVEISYPTTALPAGGGTASDTGTDGSILGYTFTSGASASTAPSSTFGSSSITKSYSMDSVNGFTINTSTGVVTVGSRGTTTGDELTSNTVTKSIIIKWTPTNGYGNTIQNDMNAVSAKLKQQANFISAVVFDDDQTYFNVSYPTVIPAGGGTSAPVIDFKETYYYRYASGASSQTHTNTTNYSVTFSGTNGNGFTMTNNFSETGIWSASSRGTTTGDTRHTIYTTNVYGWGDDYEIDQDADYVYQQANALEGATGGAITWINCFYDDEIPASGGSQYPTVTVKQDNVKGYYTSGSYDSTNQTVYLQRGMAGTSWNFTLEGPDSSHFTINHSTGEVSAPSHGTNIEWGVLTTEVHPSVTGYSNVVATYTPIDSDYPLVTQEANTITGVAQTSACTISASWNTIPAAGGTNITPSTYTYSGWAKARYTSGAQDSTFKTLSSLNAALYTYTAGTTSPTWLKVKTPTSGVLSATTNTNEYSTRSANLGVKLYLNNNPNSSYYVTSASTSVTQAKAEPSNIEIRFYNNCGYYIEQIDVDFDNSSSQGISGLGYHEEDSIILNTTYDSINEIEIVISGPTSPQSYLTLTIGGASLEIPYYGGGNGDYTWVYHKNIYVGLDAGVNDAEIS